jgi:hypothetical protein
MRSVVILRPGTAGVAVVGAAVVGTAVALASGRVTAATLAVRFVAGGASRPAAGAALAVIFGMLVFALFVLIVFIEFVSLFSCSSGFCRPAALWLFAAKFWS